MGILLNGNKPSKIIYNGAESSLYYNGSKIWPEEPVEGDYTLIITVTTKAGIFINSLLPKATSGIITNSGGSSTMSVSIINSTYSSISQRINNGDTATIELESGTGNISFKVKSNYYDSTPFDCAVYKGNTLIKTETLAATSYSDFTTITITLS